MLQKNMGIHGFLGPSWVLITTHIICPPVIAYLLTGGMDTSIPQTLATGGSISPTGQIRPSLHYLGLPGQIDMYVDS